MRNSQVAELEQKIADLKARWPAHSVPPSMWQQLEELEGALEEAKANSKGDMPVYDSTKEGNER